MDRPREQYRAEPDPASLAWLSSAALGVALTVVAGVLGYLLWLHASVVTALRDTTANTARIEAILQSREALLGKNDERLDKMQEDISTMDADLQTAIELQRRYMSGEYVVPPGPATRGRR